MLGGFGTWQPLVSELHCREESLSLMQSRARRAGRHQAGHQQAPLVVRGYPWWTFHAWGLEA